MSDLSGITRSNSLPGLNRLDQDPSPVTRSDHRDRALSLTTHLPDRGSLDRSRARTDRTLTEPTPLNQRRADNTETGFKHAMRRLGTFGGMGLGLVLSPFYGLIVKTPVAIAKAIYHSFQGKETPPNTIGLRTPDDQTQQLSSALLPRLPKGTDVNALTQNLQQKIDRGHQLLQDIRADNLDRPATQRDVSDIMWCLQVQAEAKYGSHFDEGGFTIPDPGHKIRDFFDSNPQAYQRQSSHIESFQGMPGGQHRGIDVNGGPNNTDGLFPNGMKTVMYGALNRDDNLKMPEDRLFLKMEPHGAWLSTPPTGRDTQGPGRGMNRHDYDAFLGHSFGFLGTLGRKITGNTAPAGTLKERLPPELKNDYNALKEKAGDNQALKDILNQGNPTGTAGGVRVMKANVETLLARNDLPDPLRDDLNQFQQNFLQGNWQHSDGNASLFDHPELRIGNEVVFTANELGL